MRTRQTAVVAVAILALAGCSTMLGPDGPRGTLLVRGPVETITHRATASGMLVRAGPGSAEPCGIQATVTTETQIFQRNRSGALRGSELSAIAEGDTVEVYVDGPVMESCPVQGGASALVEVVGP